MSSTAGRFRKPPAATPRSAHRGSPGTTGGLWLAFLVWIGASAAGGATAAHAQPPADPADEADVAVAACRPDDDGPLLLLGFEGAGWPDALVEETRDLFRATAEGEGFEVCDARARRLPGTRVAATLVLARPRGAGNAPAVQVALTVEDEVTRKRVGRDLDLGAFPEDSRAIALSAAGHELLRASWIELATARGRAREADAPAAVRRVVDDEVRDARRRGTTLGLRLVFDAYGGGERLLGGDVFLTVWPLAWLGIEVDVGLRAGLERGSENGAVQATAAAGGLSALARVLGDDDLALAVVVGARVLGVRFDARPNPGATGRDDVGIAGVARGGLVLLASPAPALELRVGVTAGATFRGVAALDDDRRVTAVDGWELAATTGAGLRF